MDAVVYVVAFVVMLVLLIVAYAKCRPQARRFSQQGSPLTSDEMTAVHSCKDEIQLHKLSYDSAAMGLSPDLRWMQVVADGATHDGPDTSFIGADDFILPEGQKLELAYMGSVLLAKVVAYHKNRMTNLYTVHFFNGELPDLDVNFNLHASRWVFERESRPFRLVDDEDLVEPDAVLQDIFRDHHLDTPERSMVSFVRRAREIFQTEPALLEIPLDRGLCIVGDIHGNFEGLLTLLKACGHKPPSKRFLFLGDYVDRGPRSLECLVLLLAWKIKYPKDVFMIRGNHEDHGVNALYGFMRECKQRHTVQLYRQLNTMFNYLPLAAVAGDTFFCHGGIGPGIVDLDTIRNLTQYLPCEVPCKYNKPWQQAIQDLTWADPHNKGTFDMKGFGYNEDRNISVIWSEEATDRFLQNTGLKMIIRAHELVQEGFAWSHSGKVLTVFSSNNYCDNENAAAILLHEGDCRKIQYWSIDSSGSVIANGVPLPQVIPQTVQHPTARRKTSREHR